MTLRKEGQTSNCEGLRPNNPKPAKIATVYAISQEIRAAQLRINSVESVELVDILRSVVETRKHRQAVKRESFQEIRKPI